MKIDYIIRRLLSDKGISSNEKVRTEIKRQKENLKKKKEKKEHGYQVLFTVASRRFGDVGDKRTGRRNAETIKNKR